MPDSLDILTNELDFPEGTFASVARSPEGHVLQLVLRLFVSYTGDDTIKDVNISVRAPPEIMAQTKSIALSDGHPMLATRARAMKNSPARQRMCRHFC